MPVPVWAIKVFVVRGKKRSGMNLSSLLVPCIKEKRQADVILNDLSWICLFLVLYRWRGAEFMKDK